MKLFGYWWRESPSGNQHLISPTPDEEDIVAVPQDRIVGGLRKLPFKEKGVTENPRRCVFEVEPWLEAKPQYQQFREAVFGKDYF